MTLLELLMAGRVQEFNARRGQRVMIDLYAADLANLDLKGADLSGANLEKADLSGADLTDAALARATLSGADLTGATLDRCVAIKARLREAFLGDARAIEVEMSGADLSEAELVGIYAPKGRFASAKLRGAVLTRAQLPHAHFDEARLSEADLRGTDLTGASMRDADLTGANLEGACLEGADLSGARLGNAKLAQARLAGARLVRADLTGADLSGALLDGADLSGADLTDAIIDPAWRDRLVEPVTEEAEAPEELAFDDVATAATADRIAALWENAEGEDELVLRVMVAAVDGEAVGPAVALPIASDQVVARTVLPVGDAFVVVLLVEKPGGVDFTAFPIHKDGTVDAPRVTRLGYAPAIKPIFRVEDGAVVVYGIGRQGAISAHTWDGGTLTERFRSSAATLRGFCGRYDPIVLGKGGTVAPVQATGVGKILSAPAGFPGRLVAAASDGARVALLWTVKGENGVRVWRAGVDDEPWKLDPTAEVSAVDLAAVGGRWLVVWSREPEDDREPCTPMACWLGPTDPPGRAFPLLGPDLLQDVEDLRLTCSAGPPIVMLQTIASGLLFVEPGSQGALLRGRLG